MSIYKRGKFWWISITGPSGQRIQQSAKTTDKKRAQEYHDTLKAELWRIEKLKQRPTYYWQDAVTRWIQESEKKTLDNDILHLRWVDPFLYGKPLAGITSSDIDQLRLAKKKTGVKNSTVNRMLEVVRAILNRCEREWDYIDKAPFVRMLSEPQKRIRWLTHAEFEKLLDELPSHLSAMAKFSVTTGLRESNVINLRWSEIDMQKHCAWVHADEMKNARSLAIPLNKDAMRVITEQIGNHDIFVFTYNGKPVTRANNHAWRKALKRSEIYNFRWHDLRHTWASWHIQNGTPLHVLKDLGGWSDMKMVMRYAHLSPGHLSEYAGNLPNIVENAKNLLHFYYTGKNPERFELPTAWFVARYSIQLSYGRVLWNLVLW